jgi:hypothetical protein
MESFLFGNLVKTMNIVVAADNLLDKNTFRAAGGHQESPDLYLDPGRIMAAK